MRSSEKLKDYVLDEREQMTIELLEDQVATVPLAVPDRLLWHPREHIVAV